MPADSHDVTPAAGASKRTSAVTRLLRAAAFAAVLAPLGSVAVEAGIINCVSGVGCGGAEGSYVGGGGLQSNTWNFFGDPNYSNLIYSFQVAGTPAADFTLDVQDFVQANAYFAADLGLPDSLTCIPTYDGTDKCGAFDVSYGNTAPSWLPANGYDYSVAIVWFAGTNALTGSNVSIVKAPLSEPPVSEAPVAMMVAVPNYSYLFDIWYDPSLFPDPAVGGRGNGFSRFLAVYGEDLDPARARRDGDYIPKSVPELAPGPASLTLLWMGLAGVAHHVRRRRRQP